jgi:hypothetical protein
MFTIVRRVALAVASVAVLISVAAGQAGADELTDTCNRALPAFKAQCLAQDGASPTGNGVGPARGAAPTQYLSGYKMPERIVDAEGNPVLDKFGNPTTTIGEPIYSTKPGTSGPRFEGYQY